LLNETVEGLLDQLLAFLDVIEDLTAQREVAAVDAYGSAVDRAHGGDQTVGTGLYRMKALHGADGGKSGHDALLVEILDERIQRQVRQTVGVIGEELFFAFEVLLHAQQALADVAVQTGVHEGDAP